jgi:hypothetical protein
MTQTRINMLPALDTAAIAAEHTAALSTLDFNNVIAESARQHTTAGDRSRDLDRLTAALPAIIDQAMRKTITDYTPDAAKALTDTMLGILTGRLCPVWPTICTDTTPGHWDHFNHDREFTDKRGDRMIDVSFVQFTDEVADGPAKISIGGMGSEDYDPSEVREATAKIRRLLDEADEMADKVLHMQGTTVLPPAERATIAAETAITSAMTTALAGLTTNPRDVADRLHTAIDDAQAEHLARPEVGDFTPHQARSSEAFSTATYAMARALTLAPDPASTAQALRVALNMTADELTNPAGGNR